VNAVAPGPRSPATVQTLAFSRDPYGFLKRLSRDYGEPCTFTMLGEGPVVLFSRHEHLRQIFALKPDTLRSANDTVRFLLDERSIVFLEGEEHKAARAVMQVPFMGKALDGYARSIIAATERELATFADGAVVPLHAAFQHITFDALLEAVVGIDDAARFAPLRRHLLAFVDGALTPTMFAAALTVGPWMQRHTRDRVAAKTAAIRAGKPPASFGGLSSRTTHIAQCGVMLHDLVRERRAAGAEGRSVLDRFVARADSGFSDHDIVQELLTLFVAGHDTTSIALCWAIVALMDHPRVVERLRDEVAPAMAGGTPDPAALAACTYLDAVVSEVMRFYPPSPLVPRVSVVDVAIGGVPLAAGVRFGPNIIGAHFSEAAWGDPDVFRPERFVDEWPADAFVPFGGGHRRCLGAAFTRFEMRIVLAMLLTRWRLEPAAGHSRAASVHGILIGLRRPLRAIVKRAG
jgi:cytochrome P450